MVDTWAVTVGVCVPRGHQAHPAKKPLGVTMVRNVLV